MMKVAVNSLNASLATYFVLFFNPQLLYKASYFHYGQSLSGRK